MNTANMPKGKILVADDSLTVVNILQAMLENEGYEVVTAMDGIGAINRTYQEQPDLIVLDIFMPGINGYQVCRLLKSDEITSYIPVVMLTGSEAGDRFWSLQTGADEFRTKDFEFQGLLEVIENLLQRTLYTDVVRRPETDTSKGIERGEEDSAVQIMSKLSLLLDRELYGSTVEKIRLETILDNLGEGVLSLDADKRIVAFNKSLEKMTGLSQEEVLGKECGHVMKLPLCNEHCLFSRVAESEDLGSPSTRRPEIAEVETELEGPDGKKTPVSLYMAPLRDDMGKSVGAVCVCRDITRIKEIERMNDELSKAYKELQDAQDQLIQSEKMASLGRLVAGAAHELNNPISFIYSNISHLRGYIQDMKTVIERYEDLAHVYASSAPQIAEVNTKMSDVEELKEELDLQYVMSDLDRLVADMDEGARRTKGIVEDLKAFSRSGEGRVADTDINEDIEKSLSLLVDYHKDRITIHKDYADIPRVKCYTGQIGQVFMNLIVNACQAIEGEGDIWITTRLEDRIVIISVRDNGAGIAGEDVSNIFDPFFTTRDVGEGAGLGLSISYGIAQRHKGEILVDSQVGSGTTFTFRLPLDFESRE